MAPMHGWSRGAAMAALLAAAPWLGAQDGAAPELLGRNRSLGAGTLDGEAGARWEGELLTEWTAALRGAGGGGSGRYVASFRLDADLERLLALSGGTLLMDFESNRGTSPDASIDAFGAGSGLEAPPSDQISELWYGQVLGDGCVRGKLGVLDASTAFAAVESAAAFFAGSAGTSPTILGLPSWPVTAPGIELFLQPAQGLSLGVGVYDGASAAPLASSPAELLLPAGPFVIGETGLSWPSRRSGLGSGRVAFGAWHSGADYARFDGGVASGVSGYYALLEQQLWRERPRRESDDQGLAVFALYGRADEAVAEAGAHYLAGAVYRGALPRRDHDEIGVMVSHVDLSDAPGAGYAADETTLEFYAKLQLGDSSSIAFSWQHVFHPAGDAFGDPADGIGLRFEVAF